jgi:tetratricopeptide (TPR) repeat protein
VAVVFFEHACRLDPANENFQAMYLNALKWTDYAQARAIAEPILNESEEHIPNLVIQAAEVLFASTQSIPEHDAVPLYRRIISILTPLLARTKDEEGLEHPTQVSMILLLLATCHRWLGEIKEAYHSYSQAIVLEPWNEALFTARGMIVYGTNQSAISDFEEAIKLDSPQVWPYFYLAHYLLTQNRFEECRKMCERALGKPAPERVQSELCEFLGISLTHLHYPSPVIQRAFENAIRVDSSNDRAKQNLQRFLEALAAKPQKPVRWEQPNETYIRNSGLRQTRRTPAASQFQEFALA